MALPKIKQPEYPIYLHTLKETVHFKPYTTGEEKIIMMVQSSNDPEFIARNLKTVISNCIVEDVDVNKLLSYDIENLLIKIRGKSGGEVIKLKYKHEGKAIEIDLNLEDAIVEFDPKHLYNIPLTDEIGLTMRDLTFDKLLKYQQYATGEISNEKKVELSYSTVLDCVEAIYDADNVYRIGEETTYEELEEFVNNFTGISNKLFNFLNTMPSVVYKTTLPDGEPLVIRNIRDFLD
jgi:hypothetical protein